MNVITVTCNWAARYGEGYGNDAKGNAIFLEIWEDDESSLPKIVDSIIRAEHEDDWSALLDDDETDPEELEAQAEARILDYVKQCLDRDVPFIDELDFTGWLNYYNIERVEVGKA